MLLELLQTVPDQIPQTHRLQLLDRSAPVGLKTIAVARQQAVKCLARGPRKPEGLHRPASPASRVQRESRHAPAFQKAVQCHGSEIEPVQRRRRWVRKIFHEAPVVRAIAAGYRRGEESNLRPR